VWFSFENMNPEAWYRARLETADDRALNDHAMPVRMTQKLQQTFQDRSDTISKEIKLQSEALKRRENSSDILITQAPDTISRYGFSGGMTASAEEIKDAISKTLLYLAMEVRYEWIADAHARTFTRILNPSTRDRPWDNFMEWL
jgi:hypothetical protein